MRSRLIVIVSVSVLLALPGSAQTWKDVLGQLAGSQKKSEERSQHIDQHEAAQGLKQALEIGARKAVELASQKNGFLGNNLIRIPLPKNIRAAGKTLRRIGLGKTVDQFDVAMNRAAEQASAKAMPILVDAVKGLTIDDALSILRGGDTAATDLLRKKTAPQLRTAFRPIIAAAMDQTGVTRRYQQLMDQAGPLLQLTGQKQQPLDDYVTDETLDGLFTLIAEQETKIRKDPVARTTDLLRKVFGSLTKGAAASSSSGHY